MSVYTDEDIAKMEIQKAVSREAGGNGLASRIFTPPAGVLGIRWQRIREPNEVVVINGVQQSRAYTLRIEWGRLIGIFPSVQRVILNPPVLDGISATAHTKDHFKMTMVLSVKYGVLDALAVIREGDAILAFQKTVEACARDYIAKHTQDEIVKEPAFVASSILADLCRKETIYNIYRVDELTFEYETDTSRIDTRSSLLTEREKTPLIIAKEDNIDTEFVRETERKRVTDSMEEEKKKADHVREMEIERLRAETEIETGELKLKRTLVKTGGKVISATGDSHADDLTELASGTSSGKLKSGKGFMLPSETTETTGKVSPTPTETPTTSKPDSSTSTTDSPGRLKLKGFSDDSDVKDDDAGKPKDYFGKKS